MKRVLSLLLLIPFLSTQAWALRGGPFDSELGSTQSSVSGTYGITLQGTEAPGVNSLSTTGVMAVSVPKYGMTLGKILIFNKGLMYMGGAEGRVDPRSGKMTLLSQATHYTFMVTANTPYVAVEGLLSGQLDLQLSRDNISGLILVSGGATFALFDPLAKTFDQGLTQTSSSSNSTSAANQAQAINGVTNNGNIASNSTGASSQTTGTSGPVDQTVTSINTTEVVSKVQVLDDGSVVTTTTTTTRDNNDPTTVTTQSANTSQISSTAQRSQTDQQAATGQSASTSGSVITYDLAQLRRDIVVPRVKTVQGQTSVSLVDANGAPSADATATTVGLRVGMAVSGPGIPPGATIVSIDGPYSMTLSKAATASTTSTTDRPFAANSSSAIYLTMTADGMREDSQTLSLPTLTAPGTANDLQVGVSQIDPVTGSVNGATGGGATGGNTGGAAGGATGGATGGTRPGGAGG